MKVYVETNFVLELALEQESFDACETILRWAEQEKIALALPAFSLFEPMTTLHRRRAELQRLRTKVANQLREIGRTRSLSDAAYTNDVDALFQQSMNEAERRFGVVRERLLAAAELLRLDKSTMQRAEAMHRRGDLPLPDSIVLASVVGDPSFGAEPSCFLNRNAKDFDDPAVVDELRAGDCKLFVSFDRGRAFVGRQLASH